MIWSRYADHPIFTGKPAAEADPFGPQQFDLPPVEETANPYQSPQT